MFSRGRSYISLLALLVFSPFLMAAGSIFDDEGWEDPEIEAEPAPQIERDPTPPPVRSKPTPAPRPRRDVQTEQPEVSEPEEEEEAEEAEEAPSTAEPEESHTPEEIIKIVTKKIKDASPLPAKLEDPAIIHLFHQKAVAHARLGQLKPARYAMAKVMAAKLSNKSIVLNAARLDIVSRTDAMRAATNLQKYMTAHPEDADALDLWGVALATVVRSKRRLPDEKVEQFISAQTLVEQTRPGFRRWGVEWVDAARWDEMEREREEILQDVRLHEGRVREARQNYEYVRRTYSRRRIRVGRISRPDPAAQAYIAEAEGRVVDAQRELMTHVRRLPRPKWVMPLRMSEPELQMEPKEVGLSLR